MKGVGWELLKGGFNQSQATCAFLCPFPGLPASLVMEVCGLCAICAKNPGSLALLTEATRGNHWKVRSESDLPQSQSVGRAHLAAPGVTRPRYKGPLSPSSLQAIKGPQETVSV